MKRVFVLGILILLVSSNLRARKIQAYKLKLVSVEFNNDEAGVIKNKSNRLNLISPQFSDSLININWSLEPTHLVMELMNKSDNNFKVLWDELTFICTENISQRMIHTGRMIYDLEDKQLPTVVVKKSKITDCIAPVKNARWRSTPVGGNWIFDDLFYEGNTCNNTIRILLPLEMGSQRHEYLFSFVIEKDSRKLKIKNTHSSLKIYRN